MVQWRNKVRKKHENIIQNWHLNDNEVESRRWKLIYGLAEESDFNDDFVDAGVTDDTKLLCFSIGYK